MLKKVFIVFYSVIAISSAKADSDKVESLDSIKVPGVTIGNSPDNLYKVPRQQLSPRIQALKVTPRYIKSARGVGMMVTSRRENLKQNWACTAFCVAEDVIATSAHCFARAKGGNLPALDDMVFRLRSYELNNSQRPRVLIGEMQISSIQSVDEKNPHLAIYSGHDFTRRTVKSIAKDWAFAKLQSPICQGKSLLFKRMKDDELIAAGNDGGLFMIAYDKWNTREPLVASNCRIFSRSDTRKFTRSLRRTLRRNKAIVIHDCYGAEGSSGGPIFANMDSLPRVVAINHGAIVSEKHTPIKRVRRGNKVSVTYEITKEKFKSATHAGDFIEGFSRYQEENLLNSLDEFEEVQSYLKDLRLYYGKIDGLLGPGTKRALIRYEKRAGLVPIGLPTQRLLSLLRSELKRKRPPIPVRSVFAAPE